MVRREILYSFPRRVILGLFLQQDFVAGQNILTTLVASDSCSGLSLSSCHNSMGGGEEGHFSRGATELRAKDPKTQGLVSTLPWSSWLVPRTEWFETNDRDFHC